MHRAQTKGAFVVRENIAEAVVVDRVRRGQHSSCVREDLLALTKPTEEEGTSLKHSRAMAEDRRGFQVPLQDAAFTANTIPKGAESHKIP